MGDIYSNDGVEPKGKRQKSQVDVAAHTRWDLYISVKDRRLPDGGLVDGGLIV